LTRSGHRAASVYFLKIKWKGRVEVNFNKADAKRFRGGRGARSRTSTRNGPVVVLIADTVLVPSTLDATLSLSPKIQSSCS
jgi:hypothetical protein